ncbi:MAG: hypothetical protein JSV95_07610 [Gemmatimonadota bacterium]|jgi:hypothetical protein|nr:MAG: hypothetical protein JSV95_07610 [Gemmatimonadota bacterium]
MESLEILAPAIITVILILTVGAVVLLRPLSKQGAALLEQMLKDRREGREGHQVEHLTGALANLSDRVSLLEERLTFTESLIEAQPGGRARIASGADAPPPDD